MNRALTIVCGVAFVAGLGVACELDRAAMHKTCHLAPNVALCEFAWSAGGQSWAEREKAREWAAFQAAQGDWVDGSVVAQ